LENPRALWRCNRWSTTVALRTRSPTAQHPYRPRTQASAAVETIMDVQQRAVIFSDADIALFQLPNPSRASAQYALRSTVPVVVAAWQCRYRKAWTEALLGGNPLGGKLETLVGGNLLAGNLAACSRVSSSRVGQSGVSCLGVTYQPGRMFLWPQCANRCKALCNRCSRPLL
jgi:hypothetical protein